MPAAGEEVRQAVLRAAQGDFVRCDIPSQPALLALTVSPVRSKDGTLQYLLVEARDVTATGGEVLLTVRGTELRPNDTRERYRQKSVRIAFDPTCTERSPRAVGWCRLTLYPL